jgi:hypothetical protein
MDDIWMTNHLVSDSNCNTLNNMLFHKSLQGVTNNVGLTSSVGDTMPHFTISIEQDNQELVTLIFIFSVAGDPYVIVPRQ